MWQHCLVQAFRLLTNLEMLRRDITVLWSKISLCVRTASADDMHTKIAKCAPDSRYL
jgi:hypothetical protein